jgi:hypothetical protein
MNFDIFLFIHLVGIIIALGSVTVIDWLGFLGRKNLSWKQTTIKAHHITKPLIWIGTTLVLLSWIPILISSKTIFPVTKSIILTILILNGSFLSFYISPRLNKSPKNKLLSKSTQNKIFLSFIVSFISWWVFVILTTIDLSN